MFRGLNRFLLAGLAAGVFLVVPPGALAGGCGGNPSAVNVYKECVGTGGGGTAASGATPPSGPTSGPPPLPRSSPAGPKAKAARHDRRGLAPPGEAHRPPRNPAATRPG